MLLLVNHATTLVLGEKVMNYVDKPAVTDVTYIEYTKSEELQTCEFSVNSVMIKDSYASPTP